MSRLTAICRLSFIALNNQVHAADDGGCPIKYIENGKISGTQNETDFNTMKAVTRVFMERYFAGLGTPKIEVVIPSRDCAVLSGAQFKHDLKLYRIPDTQCTFQLDTSDNLMFGRINFGNLSGEYKTEVAYYNNWSIVVQGQGEAVCDGPTISAPDKLFIRAGTCWQNYVASTFGRAPIDRILRAFTYIFTKLCPMAVLSPN